MAAPRPLRGVISRLLSLVAAPKPFWAAALTMAPFCMSNCTTTLCITMMPTASTENCSPRGTPWIRCRVTSCRGKRQSAFVSRSWG